LREEAKNLIREKKIKAAKVKLNQTQMLEKHITTAEN
jgi:hypothetical protein